MNNSQYHYSDSDSGSNLFSNSSSSSSSSSNDLVNLLDGQVVCIAGIVTHEYIPRERGRQRKTWYDGTWAMDISSETGEKKVVWTLVEGSGMVMK